VPSTIVTEPTAPVEETPVTETLAVAETVTEPTPLVPATPVTETFASDETVTVPTAPVPLTPVTSTFASATTVTEPTDPVPATPVTVALESPTTVTEPTAPVAATPVTSTGMGSPHAPWPQVPLPQPVTFATTYSLLIMTRILLLPQPQQILRWSHGSLLGLLGHLMLGNTNNRVRRVGSWELHGEIARTRRLIATKV